MILRKFISVGPLCFSAENLRLIGLRQESYPFDWVFSNVGMVQHCIETGFEKFLDADFLRKVGENKSTNTFYGEMFNREINTNVIFNHHDLTNPDLHSIFKKRCDRFMEEYRKGHIGLLYTTYASDVDDDRLKPFAEYISRTSPGSKLVVMKLEKTGENKHFAELLTNHFDIYRVCYGELDNLASVKEICMSYII